MGFKIVNFQFLLLPSICYHDFQGFHFVFAHAEKRKLLEEKIIGREVNFTCKVIPNLIQPPANLKYHPENHLDILEKHLRNSPLK